jgi:hypothetical protein
MAFRTATIALLATTAVTGCLEELNSGAESGTPAVSGNSTLFGDAGPAPDAGAALESGGLGVCQNGNVVDPSSNPIYCADEYPNQQIPALQTPVVELPDGDTTMNPCDLVEIESYAVRETYCSGCHGHPGINTAGVYHTILDDNYANGGGATLPDGGPTLFATYSKFSGAAPDGGPLPIVVPGDHANSPLYVQVFSGKMPLPTTSSSTVAKPNVSEIALLGAWIDSIPVCFGPQTSSGGGGGDDGGGGDALDD